RRGGDRAGVELLRHPGAGPPPAPLQLPQAARDDRARHRGAAAGPLLTTTVALPPAAAYLGRHVPLTPPPTAPLLAGPRRGAGRRRPRRRGLARLGRAAGAPRRRRAATGPADGRSRRVPAA